MNFLQLVEDFHGESGLSSSAPASVANQTGERKKIVNWVKNAWLNVQTSRESWRWMRATASVQTVADDGSYSAADFGLSRWGRWKIDTFRIYLTASGVADDSPLWPLEYDEFRRRFLVGAQTADRPQFVTEAPDGSILIGPKPNDVYTLYGDYYKSAQTLVQDGDVPELPADYHRIIVWRALMRYAASDGDAALYDDAKINFEQERHRLEMKQLEDISMHDETLVE